MYKVIADCFGRVFFFNFEQNIIDACELYSFDTSDLAWYFTHNNEITTFR
jgi:hypothetical protein